MGRSLGSPVSGARPRVDDPIPDIDLADPTSPNTAMLDCVLAGLRGQHPVFWHAPKSRPGFWAVIGHAEAVRVYRETETFSASHGMTIDSLRPDPDPASGIMVEVTDPPEHRRLRRGIGAFFADGAVAELAPLIDTYVGTLFASLRERGGTVDVVSEISAAVPTYVAGLLLGLPPADLGWITARTAQVLLVDAPGSGGELRVAAEQANVELLAYFAKLARTARRRPDNGGMVARLAAGTATRDGLSTGEVVLNSLNLAIGGTQTTRNLLANLVRALVESPTAYQFLRDDRTAVTTAVEEAVRWANPVAHVARIAVGGAELGGQVIRAGDRVVVWHRSVNRDAAVFEQPDEFDVRRHPNPHIGFATGPHSCPGAGMARAQARTVLHHMIDLFERVEPAGPAERLPSNFLHGYRSLPVRFTAAS